MNPKRRRRASRGSVRKADRVRDVYFVQAGEGGPIKIGVSNDSQRRLGSLQTFSPAPLHLLGVLVCPSYGDGEAWVHNEFRHLRRNGEWFEPAPELIAFIEEYALDDDEAMAARQAELQSRGKPATFGGTLCPAVWCSARHKQPPSPTPETTP